MTAFLKTMASRMRTTVLAMAIITVPAMHGTIVRAADGQEIYDNYCALCHDKGMLGAPRFGQKKDWKKRLPNGDESLVASAINGLNNMPPKGGYKRILSDDDVRAAALHLLQSVR